MYSLTIADDGRILSATFEQFNPFGLLVEELPEGNITDYKVEVTEATEETERVIEYIYDPLPKPEPEPVIEITLEERINDLEIALCEIVDALSE